MKGDSRCAGALLLMQVNLIEEGASEQVVQETRLWDEGKQVTMSMRKKEGLADYRYFPEPDLPPLEVSEAFLQDVQVSHPTCAPCLQCHAEPTMRSLGYSLWCV